MIRNHASYSRSAMHHGASPDALQAMFNQEVLSWYRNGTKVRKWITVPYRDQAEAKQLGAKRDEMTRQWFIPPYKPWKPFLKWLDQSTLDHLNASGEIN